MTDDQTVKILEEMRDMQRQSFELQKEQFEFIKKHHDRAEAIQDRAETLQNRATAAFKFIVPGIILCILSLLYFMFSLMP